MRPRQMVDRLREERRVRRDFERLINSDEDFRHLDNDWIGDRTPKPPVWKRGWRYWVSRVALATLILLIVSAVTFLYAPLPFDPPAPLQTAFVYDRNGDILARIRPDEDRVVLSLDKIPEFVQKAVIASEDERFYDHPGVDLAATLRAAWNDLRGKRLQGGSTLTQQLVKEYYVGPERSLWRKLKEAALAIRLERKFSKDQILEKYLNVIYLGDQAYGVEAASQRYFGKSVRDVSLAEAALLASIAPAPAHFNPRLDRAGAKVRRNRVLDRMAVNGFITRAEAETAKGVPIKLARAKPPPSKASLFVQYVRTYLEDTYGKDELYKGGLQIHTTLDLGMQQAAEAAIADTLNQRGDPIAALVAVDVRTGGILAMAQKHGGVFNFAAQGGRQAGSSFKPFVLATAFDEGIGPDEVYPAPSEIQIGNWNPHNYDGHSYGYQTVRTATINSINTVYAQIIEDVGWKDAADMAHKLGIESPLTEDLTLTLGTSPVTPLEMTQAYATFAARGIRHRATPIQKLLDSEGTVLDELSGSGTEAIDPELAGSVTEILQDVVRSGTGAAAALDGYDAAGKTGTTNSHRDAWFCGYTTEVAACVWMGYKKLQPMENVHGIRVSGGSFPAQIWNRFMSQVPVPEHELEGGTMDFGSGGSYIPPSSPSPSTQPSTQPTTDPTEPPPPTTPPGNDCGILPIC
jgi:penicillin-binding protein 1A